MKIQISSDRIMLGEQASSLGARWIKEAIVARDEANIILATGQSQFETLEGLIQDQEIDWSKVRMFHLDEYIGLPLTHKASFRKYLTERFVEKVPNLKEVILIDGEAEPIAECARLASIIEKYSIDVAFVGIGENGHLAFNDPPADFDTEEPYIIVNLDGPCREQQLNEGWFTNLDEVPSQAISMSVKQILKAKRIICAVPDARKADAVKNCLENEISNNYPASILREHGQCHLFLDQYSASLLANKD